MFKVLHYGFTFVILDIEKKNVQVPKRVNKLFRMVKKHCLYFSSFDIDGLPSSDDTDNSDADAGHFVKNPAKEKKRSK